MSGGALDYAYSKIDLIIDDIEKQMDDEAYSDNQKLKKAVSFIKEDLNKLKDNLYLLEWYLSGDAGEDELSELLIRMKKKL